MKTVGKCSDEQLLAMFLNEDYPPFCILADQFGTINLEEEEGV